MSRYAPMRPRLLSFTRFKSASETITANATGSSVRVKIAGALP